MDVFRGLLTDVDRFGPVPCFQDPIAQAPQSFTYELAAEQMVVDNHDRFRTAANIWGQLLGGRLLSIQDLRFGPTWKVDGENRAVARFALKPDVSPVLLDEPVDGRESKS